MESETPQSGALVFFELVKSSWSEVCRTRFGGIMSQKTLCIAIRFRKVAAGEGGDVLRGNGIRLS